MFDLVFYTGNGYNCSCCRVEYTEVENFDSIEDLVDFCVSTASGNEYDFGIDTITIYDECQYTPAELEHYINSMIDYHKDIRDIEYHIKSNQDTITNSQWWLDDVEKNTKLRYKWIEECNHKIMDAEAKLKDLENNKPKLNVDNNTKLL